MTKREVIAIIASALADNADVKAYCENELALLDRKAAKSAEKAAEKATAYDGIKATVTEVLATAETGLTVTEMLATGKFDGITNQKLSYILTTMYNKGNGTITKTTNKGKSYYSLA